MAAKQQKVKIPIPKGYNPAQRKAIALEVIDFIVRRTQGGKDKNNRAFPKYSKEYKQSLDFKNAGKSGQVNLTLSGDMLADIELLKQQRGELTVGFEGGTETNARAEGNILGTYGQKTSTGKKRDFLGLTKKALGKILKDFPLRDKEELAKKTAAIQKLIGKSEKISAGIVIEDIEEKL